jgi:hypothetical protein
LNRRQSLILIQPRLGGAGEGAGEAAAVEEPKDEAEPAPKKAADEE